MSDDSPSPDELKDPKPMPSTIKHIYFDEEHDDAEDLTTTTPTVSQKIIERPLPSTIRVDGSDLISRCKDFLPIFSDSNQNLSSEKDKLNENIPDEINLPDIEDNSLSEKSSKESGEASSTTDNDKQTEVIKKKRKKKKKKKKKKLKTNDDNDLKQESHVNN
jgi:hypothetical protein